MATSSEIKAGLDSVAEVIRNNRVEMKRLKDSAAATSAALSGLATDYADVIASINAFAAGTTNAFEMLAKAELAKLTAEFQALKASADTVAAINLG